MNGKISEIGKTGRFNLSVSYEAQVNNESC